MLITVQSFEAIGRRSSEILCLVKKTSRLKQKAFGTNVPGGLTRSQAVARIADRTASQYAKPTVK